MATYSVNLSAGKVNYTVAKYNYICRNEKYGGNKSRKLVEKFIENNLPKQPYTYAIHSKPAKMNPNHMNIHVHLIFSDRMLEEDRNISIEEFFKRHSRKKRRNYY